MRLSCPGLEVVIVRVDSQADTLATGPHIRLTAAGNGACNAGWLAKRIRSLGTVKMLSVDIQGWIPITGRVRLKKTQGIPA